MSRFNNIYNVSNFIRVVCALAATAVVASLPTLLSSENFMQAVFSIMSGVFALSISVFGRNTARSKKL
jgi:hypothetical protein